MKLQKNVALCSGIISFVALFFSYVFRCDEYISGILVGLFSSGILICVVSIITFFNERDRVIYSLYIGCYDFMNALNANLRPDGMIAAEDIRRNFKNIIDVYNKSVYFHLCQLNILPKNTKLNKIIMEIWETARHIYLFVVEDNDKVMKYYLGDISEKEIRKNEWKYVGKESVAYIEQLQSALDKLRTYMNYYNCRKDKKETVSKHAD